MVWKYKHHGDQRALSNMLLMDYTYFSSAKSIQPLSMISSHMDLGNRTFYWKAKHGKGTIPDLFFQDMKGMWGSTTIIIIARNNRYN